MNKNPNEVKIGHWWTMCCILDLYQIEDDETLADVKEYLEEVDEPWGVMTWATLKEAVDYLGDLDERPDLKKLLEQP